MTDSLVTMQHASKGPAAFSHNDVAVDSDENGIISIPSHLAGHAMAHGFSVADAPKAVKKPLSKVQAEEEMTEIANSEKPAEEDAPKAVKGGRK